MAYIVSVETANPPYCIDPQATTDFIEQLFGVHHDDINRLLKVVQNGEILNRHISAPVEWFRYDRSFREKNDLYIEMAVELGIDAIKKCVYSIQNTSFEHEVTFTFENIDALFFISSTGIATPTIDARIMNRLPFAANMKRIPIWGLGCAGGVAGISRAYEYCKAYPTANVLVLCIELCSLTFQRNDFSKSNLIGTSLFADGAACALIAGEQSLLLAGYKLAQHNTIYPRIFCTSSTFMNDSEDVMGWDLKDNGLNVLFSKDIPTVIRSWLGPNIEKFLYANKLAFSDIAYFIAHPGGKKVLQAYRDSLSLQEHMTELSRSVLRDYGNMSSPTVLFVLERHMKTATPSAGEKGIMLALGPGFSSEVLLFTSDYLFL